MSSTTKGHPAVVNPMRPALIIGALGGVFGDIGTSPIYTLRQCLKAAGEGAAPEAVLGLLSLVFWSLVIVVTTKYVARGQRRRGQHYGAAGPRGAQRT